MKRRIRLTESDLHRIIKESVNAILNEGNYEGDYEEQQECYCRLLQHHRARILHRKEAVGAVIGSHIGPGACGLIYIAE